MIYNETKPKGTGKLSEDDWIVEIKPEWYHGEAVIVFTLPNPTRPAVRAFADTIIRIVKNWSPEKPLLIAYDLTNAIFTPYNRQRAIDIYDAVPLTLTGRTAIIVPPTFLGHTMVWFSNRYLRVQNERMDRQFFVERDKAIEWLAEGIS